PELGADERIASPRLSFGRGFPDANDSHEACAVCRERLCADRSVAFVMIAAPLGVADDHRGCAGILEHLGREIAGECTGTLAMAVLRANPDWGAFREASEFHYEYRRRANHHLD